MYDISLWINQWLVLYVNYFRMCAHLCRFCRGERRAVVAAWHNSLYRTIIVGSEAAVCQRPQAINAEPYILVQSTTPLSPDLL